MAPWRRVAPELSLKDEQELTRRLGETQISARMKNTNEQKHRDESSRFVYEEQQTFGTTGSAVWGKGR